MSRNQYDAVIIGVGMAGMSAARRLLVAGKKVAVVDSMPYGGGTCALRGCDPKKILVGAAELVDRQRRMADSGAAAGQTTSTSTQFLVATGARPRQLEFESACHVATSTDFLELPELPSRIVFVGGGFISMEFAHIAARAGAEVSIVHRGERTLRPFDEDLVRRLENATVELGVDLRLSCEPTRVEKAGGRGAAHGQERTEAADRLQPLERTKAGDGGRRDSPVAAYVVHTSDGESIPADLIVHGAGRIPAIEELDLTRAGIAFSREGGIAVNEYLQSTSNGRVYAAGDCAQTEGPPLTPVAISEAMVAASNMLKGNRRSPDYSAAPCVVLPYRRFSRASASIQPRQERIHTRLPARENGSALRIAERTKRHPDTVNPPSPSMSLAFRVSSVRMSNDAPSKGGAYPGSGLDRNEATDWTTGLCEVPGSWSQAGVSKNRGPMESYRARMRDASVFLQGSL
ncbi:MAG: FAD-dependent oxidoreductase [bacterium]